MGFVLTLPKLEPETCFSFSFCVFFFNFYGKFVFSQTHSFATFVCLFVEDTFDFRAKWNHKSENREERREKKAKKSQLQSTRLCQQTLLFNTHFSLISYHTASSSRWRFHCASGGANVPKCTPPPSALARQTHPMHNATSAGDGSPLSSVNRLRSSVFGLLSGRHANWQLPCECANAATLRQPITQPARHDATRWAPSPLYDCPLSPGTAHCPLAVGSSKVWLQWKHA